MTDIKLLENDRHGASLLLDAEGLRCPEPVMMLHKQVRAARAGEVIKVVATDASTERDIPRFCEFLRHPLLESEREGDYYSYWIRVRDAR
ncbi:MAG: sulfurtransferase TusA [Pseudomonadales bacterium]